MEEKRGKKRQYEDIEDIEDNEVQDQQSPQKRAKKDNNFYVNILTNNQIDEIINTIFTKKYKQEKGKPRKGGLDYSIPYVLLHNGNYWTNPYAFSWTKANMQGYATIPYKLDADQTAKWAPKSTNKKSSWLPRLPIHTVVWRWYNDYQQIPGDKDVSHLTGQPRLLTPWTLIVESGNLNRSRAACHENGWYKEKKENCNQCLRCPHKPLCTEVIEEPNEDMYKNSDNEVPGIPNKILN